MQSCHLLQRRAAMLAQLLLPILLISHSALNAQAQNVPHVSECNFCQNCMVDSSAAPATTAAARRLASSTPFSTPAALASIPSTAQPRTLAQTQQHGAHTLSQHQQDADLPGPHFQGSHSRGLASRTLDSAAPLDMNIFPSESEIKAKQRLPNCTVCRGCSAKLGLLKAVSAFGQRFSVERGASPEWIFTTDLPQSQGGGQAVVKVWCMPVDKVHRSFQWACLKSDEALEANRFLLAQQKVVSECGLQDVTVKTWLAPVNGIEPETGLHIWWHGLWMERAQGISLNQLSYITRRTFVEDTIMGLLQTKLNKTRVLRAAMLDLLTSQCDRHAQNVFINENGELKLIDNLQAMQFHWQNCGTDSIFLPGTQKNELVRHGGNLVSKKLNAKPKRSVNPMLVLDYRCHAPDGKIGTNYPPELTKCLSKLSSMSATEVMKEYGFPYLRNAEALQSRAKDMFEKGFEWALQQGKPTNVAPKRYLWQQPCCALKVDNHQVSCGHAWNVVPEFPKGDPVTGREWTKSYPDPGTFVGGTQWT